MSEVHTIGICRECGCTDDQACTGGCSWADASHTLCSRCNDLLSFMDEDEMPCWCGSKNPYFDEALFNEPCGGSGTLNCYCGGDQCVCHWHGETECPGCEDCEHDDDYDSGDDWCEEDDVP